MVIWKALLVLSNRNLTINSHKRPKRLNPVVKSKAGYTQLLMESFVIALPPVRVRRAVQKYRELPSQISKIGTSDKDNDMTLRNCWKDVMDDWNNVEPFFTIWSNLSSHTTTRTAQVAHPLFIIQLTSSRKYKTRCTTRRGTRHHYSKTIFAKQGKWCEMTLDALSNSPVLSLK